MTKQVKKHTGDFKFKVALESFIKDEVAGVARKYGVHPNQLSLWRKDFKKNGSLVFENGNGKQENRLQKKVAQLEQLIGRKEVEINLLKGFVNFYAPPDGK
jgi:transposase-like protein